MTEINWRAAQAKLSSFGFNTGVDGLPGKHTFGTLFAYAANRKLDEQLLAIGAQASRSLPEYGISDSAERLSEFLAQTSHESAGYTRFEENMRYSAKRLMAVWPSRFPTLASALPFAWDARDPDREDVALANLVYGSRMGNQANGIDDDDGWDHRGGGMLQHTGAAEYKLLKERLSYSPDDVRDPVKSVVAACDFWQRKKLNDFCDRGEYRGLRRVVNGGFIGVEDIAARRTRILKVLK